MTASGRGAPDAPDFTAACPTPLGRYDRVVLGHGSGGRLDPLYAASEGRLVAIADAADAERVVAAMRAHPLGADARDIGAIVSDHVGVVTLRSSIGGHRILAMLAGEELPRIC